MNQELQVENGRVWLHADHSDAMGLLHTVNPPRTQLHSDVSRFLTQPSYQLSINSHGTFLSKSLLGPDPNTQHPSPLNLMANRFLIGFRELLHTFLKP